MNFRGSKADAAQYVKEMLLRSENDSQLTMIMCQDSSEAYCVSTVINMSSEDIVKMLGQACYDQLTNTF